MTTKAPLDCLTKALHILSFWVKSDAAFCRSLYKASLMLVFYTSYSSFIEVWPSSQV